MAAFNSVDASANIKQSEEAILALWNKTDAFRRQVEQREDSADNHYVFYDGPPFATGLPHYGHLVASTLKDVVPRYWAMRGKRVERRFGWDTHGLPIEMETEKALGLSGPTSIREYGVDKFNEACRASVLKYTDEWRRTINRLGRWVDFDNDYKTMDLPFMESVWWAFSQLWEKGLVYEGVRVMPFSWRLSTALSNFEANLDYRDVDDPAITVRLSVDGMDNTFLLIWTTTPWTLPSNLAVAVGEDVDYVYATPSPDKKPSFGYLQDDQSHYIVAEALVEKVLGKDAVIHKRVKGSDVVGLKYTPLFDFFADRKDTGAFQVIASDHVTTEDGTGLVHMAPAFGEDDFRACEKVGIEPVDPVDMEGRFGPEVSTYVGRNVKEADPDIIAELKAKSVLYKNERFRHSYPFCWRSGTPLIYKTVPVWFVNVEKIKDRMSAHNSDIHWVPDAVGHKRFGNWLKDARDWAISRNRFWGTPIPLWRCDACEHTECLGSVAALEEKAGATIDDIHPHKIDHHTYACEQDACSGTMTRLSDVFDCWFESGSMPYAQGHYPFENKERFEKNFPAQFIAEGLDQTRGWFYTLLVLSTALFDKAPFANCIVNGLVLATTYQDKEGNRYAATDIEVKGGKAFLESGEELSVINEKMSKSKRNYPDPHEVLDKYGADALRAYLINSPVVRADALSFSEGGVREVVRSVLIPLKNAWSFFVQYANVDDWSPVGYQDRAPPPQERSELDRWVLSVLQSLVREVNEQMKGYYLYKVVPPMLSFIDDLTNWYIRLSRRRFWQNAQTEDEQRDKESAYATLYEVLVTFSQLSAPHVPFIAESLYQNLVAEPGAQGAHDSVHLCDYPREDTTLIDETLEVHMAAVRQMVRMGRTLRERHKLKTRQPLSAMIVVSHDENVRAAAARYGDLLKAELNLKNIDIRESEAGVCNISLKANYKSLGKRLGKKMKMVAQAVQNLEGERLATLTAGGEVQVEGETIGADDVQVVYEALSGGLVIESEGQALVALETTLDDALIGEGLAREVISRVQKARKDAGLEITDRITLTFAADTDALKAALKTHEGRIMEDVLATGIEYGTPESGQEEAFDGHTLVLALQKA